MSLRLFRRSAAQLRLRTPRRGALPRPRLEPLLDRIDIHLEVPAVKYRALAKNVSEAIQYRTLDRRGLG